MDYSFNTDSSPNITATAEESVKRKPSRLFKAEANTANAESNSVKAKQSQPYDSLRNSDYINELKNTFKRSQGNQLAKTELQRATGETERLPMDTGLYITYQNVPWHLRARKEVYAIYLCTFS